MKSHILRNAWNIWKIFNLQMDLNMNFKSLELATVFRLANNCKRYPVDNKHPKGAWWGSRDHRLNLGGLNLSLVRMKLNIIILNRLTRGEC